MDCGGKWGAISQFVGEVERVDLDHFLGERGDLMKGDELGGGVEGVSNDLQPKHIGMKESSISTCFC